MGHAKKLEIHDHGRGQRPSGTPDPERRLELQNPPTLAPEKPVAIETEESPPPPAPPGLGALQKK